YLQDSLTIPRCLQSMHAAPCQNSTLCPDKPHVRIFRQRLIRRLDYFDILNLSIPAKYRKQRLLIQLRSVGRSAGFHRQELDLNPRAREEIKILNPGHAQYATYANSISGIKPRPNGIFIQMLDNGAFDVFIRELR